MTPKAWKLPKAGATKRGNDVKRLAPFWRVVIEMGFIVFLYYSNLLMGEYERPGQAGTRGFVWAVRDIFTKTNFAIAA